MARDGALGATVGASPALAVLQLVARIAIDTRASLATLPAGASASVASASGRDAEAVLATETPAIAAAFLAVIHRASFALLRDFVVAEASSAFVAELGICRVAQQAMPWAFSAAWAVVPVALSASEAIVVMSPVAVLAPILTLLTRAVLVETPAAITPVAATLYRADAAVVRAANAREVFRPAVALHARLAPGHIRVATLAMRNPARLAATVVVHPETGDTPTS